MAAVCSVCFELCPEVIVLPCACIYCHPCIRQFLSNILKDQSAYPWRCCANIVEKYMVAPALTESLSQDWDARHAQHIANQNMVPTCAWQGCGVMLQHDQITVNMAFCHVCYRETCMICRGESHGTQICPEYAAEDDQMAAMVVTERWQRCYQCRAIVHREEGCNHMTCVNAGLYAPWRPI